MVSTLEDLFEKSIDELEKLSLDDLSKYLASSLAVRPAIKKESFSSSSNIKTPRGKLEPKSDLAKLLAKKGLTLPSQLDNIFSTLNKGEG